jgi:D-arabinose 5-phosphate isomerase GutQ
MLVQKSMEAEKNIFCSGAGRSGSKQRGARRNLLALDRKSTLLATMLTYSGFR